MSDDKEKTGGQAMLEIKDLVKDLPLSFISLDDVIDVPEVDEDGDTFESNAGKKALTMAKQYNVVSLADDSGLCVDALDGRPGVYSARYGGKDSSDEQKYLGILNEMKGVAEPDRTARFVCVLALAWPDGKVDMFKGVCEGIITLEPKGDGGFGYDPIFFFF